MSATQDRKHKLLKKHSLIYIEQLPPGIKRRKCGRGYTFVDENGKTVKCEKTRARLKTLAIPPSYREVYYCADENGHLQATGRDGNDKLQYFYHEKWVDLRDRVKFDRMFDFGLALPGFRRRIYRHLKDADDDKTYVMAGMARLLDKTGMRIGSDHATDTNQTYGLTTLDKNHIELDGSHFDIHYHGKGNVEIDTEGRDEIASKVIAHCAEIPGQRLFKYQDHNGQVHKIGSSQFNDFLKENMDGEFTAKDFRTWRFSVLFLEELMKACKKEDKITLKGLLETVSEKSGNTPSVLQESYVHPMLIDKAKSEDCTDLDEDFEAQPNLLKAETIFLNLIR